MICLLKLTVTTLFSIELLLAFSLRQIELFATTLIFSRFLRFQTITAERVLTDLKFAIQALEKLKVEYVIIKVDPLNRF